MSECKGFKLPLSFPSLKFSVCSCVITVWDKDFLSGLTKLRSADLVHENWYVISRTVEGKFKPIKAKQVEKYFACVLLYSMVMACLSSSVVLGSVCQEAVIYLIYLSVSPGLHIA